jgi:hypothetical protein
MAIALSPVAMVVLAAGTLPVALSAALAWKIVGAGVIVVAVLLLGIAIGLHSSAAQEQRSAALDAAILATAGACGSECRTGACGVGDCAVKSLPRSQS